MNPITSNQPYSKLKQSEKSQTNYKHPLSKLLFPSK